MKQASNKDAFYAKNGHVYKNLKHLHKGLKEMDDETWCHHVNEEKNDFSEWLKHVIEDEHLASKVKVSKTKEQALSHVAKRLNPSKIPKRPTAKKSKKKKTNQVKIRPKKIPDIKHPDPKTPLKQHVRRLMEHPSIREHTDYGIRMFAYGTIIGFTTAFILSVL